MMNIETSVVLTMIFSPYLILWRSAAFTKRHEESFKGFYKPLREKYPRSYHEQNDVIAFVREISRMNTRDTVHWVVCFCHYTQIYYALAPIWMLFLVIFLPFNDAITICIPFGHMLPNIILCFWLDGFSILLYIRCRKIQKQNPKYANVKIPYWGKSSNL